MKKLDEKLSVSAQIALSDIAQIKAAGFTMLVCNRPDGEDPDQPLWADIQATAQAQGLATAFLPMCSREDALSVMDEFRQIVTENDGPVFAYCRSGTRCEILWNMACQSH